MAGKRRLSALTLTPEPEPLTLTPNPNPKPQVLTMTITSAPESGGAEKMAAAVPPCQTQSAKLLHQHVAFSCLEILCHWSRFSSEFHSFARQTQTQLRACVCPCNCFSFLPSSAERLKSRKHKS